MRQPSSLAPSSARAAAAALFVALFPSVAAAHIELVEPAPRYELPANKSCPCGDGDSNRTCRVSAAESTDPNRSTTVSTFEAGSTITVVADEYVDHAGRMRVAFDSDGADLADFNQNILIDVPDPSEPGLSTSNPRVWEFQIQLPDMTCESCTLQVIQVMNNNTTTPVMDPAPASTYYACADIRLVPAGSLEQGQLRGTAGSANAGEAGGSASGSGGAAAVVGNGGAATAGSGGARAGANASAGGAGDVDALKPGEDEEADGGCSIRASEHGSAGGCALALLGLAAAVRRRALTVVTRSSRGPGIRRRSAA